MLEENSGCDLRILAPTIENLKHVLSHAEGSKIQNGWGFSLSFLLSSCVGQWFTPRKISSKESR